MDNNPNKDLTNNWKNKDVASGQLEVSLNALSSPSNYPSNWHYLIHFIKSKKIESILDVGCGVGACAKLLIDNQIMIPYTGTDYSCDAIDVANNQWPNSKFLCMDYQELSYDFVKEIDLILLSGLLNCLPDPIQGLRYILGIGAEKILIQRIDLTESKTHNTYQIAYVVQTYAQKINSDEIKKTFDEFGYDFTIDGQNIFLEKKRDD